MKIVVLMGGTTAEREISLSTGSGIAASLRRLGHEVFCLDSADGRRLEAGQETSSAAVLKESDLKESPGALVRVPELSQAEVVLVALHGGAGEDGTVQAVLELTGSTYTGSGPLASGIAMNKAMSKRLFEHAGIPTPRWLLLDSKSGALEADDLGPLGGFPIVVKPNDQGSTVGLSIVQKSEELAPALAEASRHSDSILLESYIPGREVTVSMLGNEALPVVEIIPEHGIYDYSCKYTPGMSRYEVPAQLPSGITDRLQELGRRAYELLGCRGVARVDFRLDPDNRPYCLELNTVPGMTSTSLVPMAAKARGISYDKLVDRMVQMAVKDRGRSPSAPITPASHGG